MPGNMEEALKKAGIKPPAGSGGAPGQRTPPSTRPGDPRPVNPGGRPPINRSVPRSYNPPPTVQNPPAPVPPLPEDYVSLAETNIKSLKNYNDGRPMLTTSQIRKILAMVNDIYNDELLNQNKGDTLSEKSKSKKLSLHVRILYDAGRDEKNIINDFIDKTKILEYLKMTGDSRKEFIRFARYVEALVAYHRFVGGKDK